jgi:hypothetical protein
MTDVKPTPGQMWVSRTRPEEKHRLRYVGSGYVSMENGSRSLKGFLKHYKPCDLIYVWDEEEWKGG